MLTYLAIVFGITVGTIAGYQFHAMRVRRHERRYLPQGVYPVQFLFGDEHVISDGSIIRYHGTDGDTAEHIWIQLERHGIKGFHSWHKNGKPFLKRTINV